MPPKKKMKRKTPKKTTPPEPKQPQVPKPTTNILPNEPRTHRGQTFNRNQVVIPVHQGKDKLLGRNHPIHWRDYRGLFKVRVLNDEERG